MANRLRNILLALGGAVVVTAAGAAALHVGASGARGGGVDLDQGWSPADVKAWYQGDQGSRLIPYRWLTALEQPDGTGLFMDPAYFERFRYLKDDGPLPVGFVIDEQDDSRLTHTSLRWRADQGRSEPWVGMSCSACHTHELTWQGKRMRVMGGSTLADFQSFQSAIVSAMQKTAEDPAKFGRFADRVLGAKATAAERDQLHGALQSLAQLHARVVKVNASPHPYGYGRLDAIGAIYNKVSLVVKPDNTTPNPADAPVSYPFLWNIGQQKWVEWNGVASNTPMPTISKQIFDPGALGRNMGEVTGVFGDVAAPGEGESRFRLSHQISSLVAIEQQLNRLKPPRWPRDLFPIDDALAAQGKAIYARNCASCHYDLPRDDLKTRQRPDGTTLEQITPFMKQPDGRAVSDTDPWMACNAMMSRGESGILANTTGDPKHPGLPMVAPKFEMLQALVIRLLKEHAPELILNGGESLLGVHPPPKVFPVPEPHALPGIPVQMPYPQRLAACERTAGATGARGFGYKARPLTGVWATGPFLHNGSVPTLNDLLLPPDQRPKTFRLGTREFDPVNVGPVTSERADNTFVFRVLDEAGQPIIGNSNAGHDYGASTFTAKERRALLEYLKVVGE